MPKCHRHNLNTNNFTLFPQPQAAKSVALQSFIFFHGIQTVNRGKWLQTARINRSIRNEQHTDFIKFKFGMFHNTGCTHVENTQHHTHNLPSKYCDIWPLFSTLLCQLQTNSLRTTSDLKNKLNVNQYTRHYRPMVFHNNVCKLVSR